MPSPADEPISVLQHTSSLLDKLIHGQAYETWVETDRDDFDGLLRELAHQAAALRPLMVAGIPDPPAGAEILERADQLLPGPRKALQLLAATVQAFEDAGLHDGTHFVNMAAHVWGLTDMPY